jgi:hypothetical protein
MPCKLSDPGGLLQQDEELESVLDFEDASNAKTNSGFCSVGCLSRASRFFLVRFWGWNSGSTLLASLDLVSSCFVLRIGDSK